MLQIHAAQLLETLLVILAVHVIMVGLAVIVKQVLVLCSLAKMVGLALETICATVPVAGPTMFAKLVSIF